MNASSLRYLIKEGFKNTWTNRMMTFASVCVLLSCLVLIGSASMIFLNINSLVDRIEDENVIMVYIADKHADDTEVTQAEIDTMEAKLNEMDNIDKVEFVSKEDAWADQLETMEDAQAQFFTEITTDIPLPNAFKVTVTDLAQFGTTVDAIKALDNIDTVRENTDLAKKLDTISHGITIIAIAIIAVLFAISLFIISNTIRLAVYSRRLEISIMKSVGATNSFVRLPFVVEGLIIGVISAIVSLGVVWGVYVLALDQFSYLLDSIRLVPLNFANYAWYMLAAFLAIGVVSGVGGSLITMRRYLNKEGSEISAI